MIAKWNIHVLRQCASEYQPLKRRGEQTAGWALNFIPRCPLPRSIWLAAARKKRDHTRRTLALIMQGSYVHTGPGGRTIIWSPDPNRHQQLSQLGLQDTLIRKGSLLRVQLSCSECKLRTQIEKSEDEVPIKRNFSKVP